MFTTPSLSRLLSLVAVSLLLAAAPAQALETNAREALLVDLETGTTLLAKDADAPIFNVADYGIVGDVFEVAPVLAAEIRRLMSD